MIEKVETFLNNRTPYVLVLVLIIGAGFRFYHINYQSLWLDELHSIVPTDPANSLESVIEYSKTDQPPLFFIYIHYAFKIFGYNEIVGRLGCALLGLVGIYGIYLLGRECGGKTAGVFCSFLTAINYFHIYYSQELRFYSMAFLFAVFSYLFFIRSFKNVKILDFVGYIFATSCLLYTHYFGLIVFGTQAITFLILLFYKREQRFFLLATASGTLIIISFLPWIGTIVNDMGADVGWIKKPEFYFVAQYFYDYTGKDFLTTFILVILLATSFRAIPKHSDNSGSIILILTCWIVIAYLVPYLRSLLVTPMLHDRYTIVILPAWIVLFSLGWNKTRNVKWKYSIVLILILSASINIIFVRQYYTRIKKIQFREASELVLLNNEEHNPVYSSLPWYFGFYFRDSSDKVKSYETGDFSNTEEFWLLQAHISDKEMEGQVLGLSENFVEKERHTLFGANAILMGRK